MEVVETGRTITMAEAVVLGVDLEEVAAVDSEGAVVDLAAVARLGDGK